jgi:two-component sensor histidine kinase
MTRRILDGTPVSEIPVYKESINRYMFDFKQMKRFGIDESELPENSILINKTVTFYAAFKEIVWGTAGIIGALLIFIGILNMNIARRKSAEEELKAAHGELEERVNERTEELSISNQLLQKEVLERKKVEAEIYSIYNAISDLITVQDTNYRILSYNKTVENTFGKDLKGRVCYEVYQGRKEICPDCAVKKAIETKKLASTLQLSLNPPSAPSVEIYAYPIIDEEGEVMAVVEHGRDVSERIQMMETIKESENQLKASLKEKEILLKEIHHRVKNNMAIVSSLLQLQSQYVDDEELKRIFSESRNRIGAMALVHEKLYQSKDFIEIDLKEYIQILVDNLFSSYNINKESVGLVTDIDNIHLDIDRLIPCGLILNELITNSLKHAFKDGEEGEIRIAFKAADNKVGFSVMDNGRGLPENVDFSNPQTLGLKLISSLTRQLRGEISHNGGEGLSVEIAFEYKAG